MLLCAATCRSQQEPAPAANANLAAFEQELTRLGGSGRNPDSPPARTNYPLALLAQKKVKLAGEGGGFGFGAAPTDRYLAEGQAALERLQRGEAREATPGELTELAYIARNDQTVQPYYLYVPRDFDRQRKYPLIVFLHGYVPSISVLDPWVLPDDICDVAGDNGCMLLIPYGRRNTDFQGVGEVDVFASLREVRDLYPVDEDRIYLSGCSMGGMGVWNIALRHPGVFAAATPMCGHTDMFRWWGWERESAPPWKRWLIEWDNAVDQALNLYGQHFLAQHGARDSLVAPEQSRLMVQAGEQLGTPIEFYEWPQGSHYIYLETVPYEKAWKWQAQFRLDRSPKTVKFKCYSLEYNRAFWLTVDSLTRWGEPAQITAEIGADGKSLVVKSDNVDSILVDSRQAGFADGDTVTVTWNDRRLEFSAGEGQREINWAGPRGPLGPTGGGEPPDPPAKRRGLCGPCEEVFDGPFVVVQGTAGEQADDDDLARKVARWASEWDEFADGMPIVRTDAEVLAGDYSEYNLVCFGTPETNSAVAGLTRLNRAITIGDHRYVINGAEYAGPELGLVVCYPMSYWEDRYALVYAGETYGERLSINHKHDLLPDFLVFTTKSFGEDDTNDALCAGFFDTDWKLDESLIWTR
jgi:acetyl esterase/lipase